MFSFGSILRSISNLVHVAVSQAIRMSKCMYRNAAVIALGTTVIAVMTFSSAGFAGGGHNALAAYAEIPTATPADTLEPEGIEGATVVEEEIRTETIDFLTEAKQQLQLADQTQLESGQKLVGDTLARDVQVANEIREEQKAAIAQTKDEIRKAQEVQEALANNESLEIECSAGDYDILKRIVEAEAGICDMKGRILVANVILNRVKSGEFPDTITQVVYQRSQFSPVIDGRINTCKVTDETVEAVNRALAGEDYSDGALYFMNRKRSQSKNVSWFDGRLTYLFYHDRHEFFK